jgi:hypothetical protein
MNWKTTLILAVIVIAGAIYIQFVEKGRDTTKDADAKGKKVFVVKDLSDHIGEIKVKREDGEFKFEKKGTGEEAAWRMVEPLNVRADKSEVKPIAAELEDITVKNVMSADGGKVDLAEFGLDKPRATVTFKALGDEYSLLVGAKSPSDKKEIFVKRGDSDKIYLVEDDIYEKVKKSKEEFRDKKVVNIEKNDVIGLQIAWGEAKDKTSVTARKEKAQWSLAVPVEDYANKSKIEGLIDHVKDLKIEKEDFVAETMGDAAKFGLDKPVLTAVVETDKEQKGEESAEGKKLKFEIVFGKEAEGKSGKIYAKRKDEGAVFAVADKILKDLTVEAVKDLRADDFGMFEKNDVNKLEISLASSNVVAEKAKRKDKDGKETEEKWKVIKPKEVETEENEVTDFIGDLDGATIKEFVSDSPTDEELEKFGLKQPATVTVHLKEGSGSLGFEVGKPHETEKDRFYARRAGRKSVYLVEKKDLHKDIQVGYLLFKEREVIKFTQSDAQKVIVARGGVTVVATKKDDKWQLTQPVTGPGDESQIKDLLLAVNSLDAKSYVAEDPKDLATFGLADPAVKLTVELKEKKKEGDEEKETERTVALLIGNKVPDQDEYYAKLAEGDNSKFVFTVTKDVYRKVTSELHDREVVNITKSDVKKLVLKSKEETITCVRDEKDADKWKITTPKEAEGKKSEIEDVLDELDPLKAERLASYKAVGSAELKPFGLDEPELTISLNLKDGKDETIEVGKLTKEDPDEYYWVRSTKKDGVYLVKKSDIDDLKKTFKDLAKVEEEKKGEGAQPKTEGGETKTEEKKPEGAEKKEEVKTGPGQ